MAYSTYSNPPVPASMPPYNNLWASVRDYFARGGFVNGLNPTVVGRTWYVSGEGAPSPGSNSNSGRSPFNAFATIAKVLTMIDDYDIIVLNGVFREQVVAPAVYDITVIGGGNDPRQATSGGVATGGGSSWLAPASPTATTPLIRVIAQSWKFINIQFAPVAASACITFDRRETVAIPDSSHGLVAGCYFTTGGANGIGVECIEVKKIRIIDNVFEALTGATGAAIKTTAGLGIAAPSHWTVRKNKFVQCVNDMNCLSLNFSVIDYNDFLSTNPIEGGKRIVLNGSTGRNSVRLNQFADVTADVTIAKGYTPATGDVWNNYTAGTAALIVTVPA